MWSVSGSVPMGGRPKAFPTPAMAGSISPCVNVPEWFLSRAANFSSTNLDHVWSFSTNAFKAFPSITVAIFAANHDVLCRIGGTTALPVKLHKANKKTTLKLQTGRTRNACLTSKPSTSQTIPHSKQHKLKDPSPKRLKRVGATWNSIRGQKRFESEKKRTKSRTVR